MKRPGQLYLLPSSLGGPANDFMSPRLSELCDQLDHFIVEDIRTARRSLRAMGMKRPFEDVHFYSLNEHTKADDVPGLMEPLLNGSDMGILSEAGLPCIADPGSQAVSYAHQNGIRVNPVSGPSSIFMALMASGMNGQQFTFNGYLPRERADRVKKIRQLEQMALTGHTQIFMDAPYRNNQVLEDLLANCRDSTRLCIAVNISLPNERIVTKDIIGWHSSKQELHKQLVMFILGK